MFVLHTQFTVCPVQDGVRVTTKEVVPIASVALTMIVPAAFTVPSETNLDEAMETFVIPVQPLLIWHNSVTEVRADDAASKTSDARARTV